MPMGYNNSVAPYYSETVSSDFALPSDWTQGAVDTFTIHFKGNPANEAGGPLYVAIADHAGRIEVVMNEDMDAVICKGKTD